MQPSRTPVDWLIAIVNIPALLLALAIGWLWIFDAAGHYQANDDHPNIRIGMCLGFAMAYLAWTSVVLTYLVLKRPPRTETTSGEGVTRRVRIIRTRRLTTAPFEESNASPPPARMKPEEAAPPDTVTTEAYQSSPPPVRVKPPAATPVATPAPEEAVDVVEADAPEPVLPPTPPSAT